MYNVIFGYVSETLKDDTQADLLEVVGKHSYHMRVLSTIHTHMVALVSQLSKNT